ncbi:MAG: LCP family protein [Actinobacteria bacterium]|nr:LCP family protein [Actinomycetota bacterium]MBU1944511.1 LCP family protein [Actinomycetota bacterium]MBU2689064.1 LCP family protein [Actinomycetota bacterium]
MGKHSSNQGISYWEARRRRKDLRNRAKGRKPVRRGPTHVRWFVVGFILAFAIGTALGFYAKPLAKLGGELYLSLKQGEWQPKGEEKQEVKEALTPLSVDPNQSVNTLIIGSDQGSNKGEDGWCRSDVMMLVCLQERDKKAVVLSIPRDTRVELPGYGTNKINAAHSYGGPSGAIDAVKTLTGIDVNHYISMNFEGFKKIINAIGGVPIHLNAPIRDPHTGYLPAGDLMLDGEQALIVVRSRNLPQGDIDRIKSQQTLIKALMNKAEDMKSVWKAKQVVDIVAANCQMDYTAGQLTNLAEELRGFDIENVQFITIPGVTKTIGGVSYFVANPAMIASIATEVKTSTSLSPELIAGLGSEESRRVELLYGPNADVTTVLASSKSGTGAVPVVAEELRLMGHEKVFEGTAKQALPSTVIYYRKEAKQNAETIKNSVPEFADATLTQDDQIAGSYNSPVVIVLAKGFATPPMMSIYGRVLRPAFEVQNLGRKVKSFT